MTFRLAGSIPQVILRKLKAEVEEGEQEIRRTTGSDDLNDFLYEELKRQFGCWDKGLEESSGGPFWLQKRLKV